MRHLIQAMWPLKDKADELNQRLSRKHEVLGSSMPIAALNMAHNEIVLTIELMSYYQSIFVRPHGVRFEDNLNFSPEQSQRVGALLNNCFVSVMSSFESCARKAVRDVRGYFPTTAKTLYLFGIMQRGKALGMISKGDELSWEILNKVRNALVHNNGEFDFTGEMHLPSGVVWKVLKGHQAQASLRHIPMTLDWALDGYYKWADNFMEMWVKQFDYSPKWNRFDVYRFNSKKHVIPGH